MQESSFHILLASHSVQCKYVIELSRVPINALRTYLKKWVCRVPSLTFPLSTLSYLSTSHPPSPFHSSHSIAFPLFMRPHLSTLRLQLFSLLHLSTLHPSSPFHSPPSLTFQIFPLPHISSLSPSLPLSLPFPRRFLGFLIPLLSPLATILGFLSLPSFPWPFSSLIYTLLHLCRVTILCSMSLGSCFPPIGSCFPPFGSCFPPFGSCFTPLGSFFHSSWFMFHSSMIKFHFSWFMFHSSWFLFPSSWFLFPSSWFMFHSS